MWRSYFLAAAMLTLLAGGQARAECGQSGVIVFSAHWCPYCRKTERFLDSRGIAYQRIETTRNARAQQFMQRSFRTTAVPVVVVDNDYVVGHNEAWLREALCLDE